MKKIIVWMLAIMLCIAPAIGEEMLKIAIPGRDAEVINYTLALMQLGAEPAVIWDEYDVSQFDGLLLPGGVDIHPSRYGQQDIACGIIDKALDEIQFNALDAFIKAGKPVMGICRGHQLLNVYFGGTLIQHIDTAPDHTDIDDVDNAHSTTAEDFVAEIYGENPVVNSSHHQAADMPGEGLIVVQRAEDGVVEAMRHESLPVISVQWHPERMCFSYAREDTVDGSAVLQYFLDMCKANG